MKKFLLSLAAVLFTITASAQVYVGGEVGFWRNFNDNHTSFTLKPEVGYNLSDKWALGIEVGYGHDYDQGLKLNGFTVSPYARFSYATFGPVTLFLDGGFGLNTYKVKDADDSNIGWQIGIQPGVKVSLAKNIDFVAHMGFLGYRDADTGFCQFGEDGFGFDFSGQNLTFGLYYNF